jgi:uncharacterized protein YegP (UPF0339 family)
MTSDDLATRRAAHGPREPAAAHFRKLAGTARAFADGPSGPVARPSGSGLATRGTFEVYREDEVQTSSTRFCGGDWHWCLSDAAGLILLDTGGYPSERACLQAVAILKETAALAGVSRTG